MYLNNTSMKDKVKLKSALQSFRTWPKIYKLLWRVNRFYFMLTIILALIIGIIPAMMIKIIEELVNNIGLQIDNWNIVILMGFFYIALVALSSIIDAYSNAVKNIYNELLSKELNIKIIDKASKIPYLYFETNEIYDNIQRVRDESTFRPFQIFNMTLGIISGIVTVTSVSTILFIWNWYIIPIIMIIPILSVYSFIKLGRQEYLINFFQATKRRELYYLSHLMTKDYHIKEIKTYNKTDVLKNKYTNKYNSIFKENKGMTLRRFKLTVIFDLLTISLVGLIIFFIIREALLGLIAVGSLVAYIQAVNKTQSSISELIRLCYSLYENNLYVEQLFKFLNLKEENEREVKPINNRSSVFENTLDLKNVSFCYPSRT